MFWLLFLVLMLLVPLLAGLHTWRELRQAEAPTKTDTSSGSTAL